MPRACKASAQTCLHRPHPKSFYIQASAQHIAQAASLEQLEQQAAASAAEAEVLREENAAASAALAEHAAAEAALAQQLHSTEGRLAQLEQKHRSLQAAHTALQMAHGEQGAALQGRLAQAKEEVGRALSAQEAAAATSAAARQEVAALRSVLEAQRSEVEAARQRQQQAEHEAAAWRGRYQAVQHANDGLRLQLAASSAARPGARGVGTGSPPALGVQLPSSPTRPPVQVTSPGCRITAAAVAAEQWEHARSRRASLSPRSAHAGGSPTCTTTVSAVKASSPGSRAGGINITAVTVCRHQAVSAMPNGS